LLSTTLTREIAECQGFSRFDPNTGEIFNNSPHAARSRQTSADASPISAHDRVTRLRALVASTRLENVITNADILSAVYRWERAAAFDSGHVFRRRTPWGAVKTLPVAYCARRWSSDAGRANIRRDMTRALKRLLDVDAESTEMFKLFTVTFRGVEESWRAAGWIRRLMNKISHYARRHAATVRYVWVAELQKRAALHYHIVLAGCPFIPRRIWKKWSPAPQSKLQAADAARAAAYLAKYCRKSTSNNNKSGDLANLLFSAARKRHWSCSRVISHRDDRQPAWVDDINELMEGVAYVVDWDESSLYDRIWVTLSTGNEVELCKSRVSWKLRQCFDYGAPP
jgi:hypothetical protein